VYVEGHASMRKFENKDGKTESALSIVQGEFPGHYGSKVLGRMLICDYR
jgi:single-stranded DNA-binding protein